jgi:hypothetical protein
VVVTAALCHPEKIHHNFAENIFSVILIQATPLLILDT